LPTTTRTRTIIHEPGIGRKIARAFGIASFILSLLSLAFVILIAFTGTTLTPSTFAGALIGAIIWMGISMIIVIASEPKKEVITEEIGTDSDNNLKGVWTN